LRNSDNVRAAQILAGHDLASTATGEGLSARLRPGDDADQAAAALNRALVEAGLSVFAIGPRDRSLEEIYRQVAAPPALAGHRQPETV